VAIEALVTRYGLLAIFAGAGVEGEAVVLTGGILARRGLLDPWAVAAAAAVGSWIVDQLWFWIGRAFRDRPWIERIKARPAFARAVRLLERYPVGFIFLFRFIYGLRTVSPIAIGLSKVRSRTFIPLNALAAAIWGPLVAWAGYGFGAALEPLLARFKAGALWVVIAAAILISFSLALPVLIRLARGRRSG
jgi:membrane protein DedA with SNARE-associated domain